MPDAAGLDYWANHSGLTLNGIAASFFHQLETHALYPFGTSNISFITSVYQNVFNRQVDTVALNHWEGKLNSGEITKNTFILAVVNAAVDSAIALDKTLITNKTIVGLSFAKAGLSNIDDAKTIIAGVTADAASMTTAVNAFRISLYEVE